MKRVYSIALAFALLLSGCAKTVEVENTDEVPVVSKKAEETESVSRTRVYGAFTVYYEDYILDKNTNGTTISAMLVYDYLGYPYTIPYMIDEEYELEKNKIYTFTIKDNIVEKPIEELEKLNLSTLLWEISGFEVVSFREFEEGEWGVETRGLQFESIDETTYFDQYTKRMPSLKTIDEYFEDFHEHESCQNGYVREVDLNGDGKSEKIVVEQLECNGGDGGYFPHVYSSDGEELIYQEDKYATPFDIDWNEGAVTISYNDEVLVDFTKENVKEIYYKLGSSEYYDISDLEETVMSAYDSKSDCASGFVVTDNGELIVKYYISGIYGHSDTFGYGVLHLTLDKENKWIVKPEFVFDSNPHKEVALDDSLEESTDEYIVSSSSPVETLPYDPDAEWNYVPLD